MKFFYTHKIFLLELFPGGRIQTQQHREQLQSACQHVKHEHIFAQHGKAAEIHRRPHLGKSRADVVKRGCHRGKVRHQVKFIQRNDQHGSSEDHQIGNGEHVDGT